MASDPTEMSERAYRIMHDIPVMETILRRAPAHGVTPEGCASILTDLLLVRDDLIDELLAARCLRYVEERTKHG